MIDPLPVRLKVDSIVEAAFEVRFETKAFAIPEIFFGKLAAADAWSAYRPSRLPTADIPEPIRRSDPNLMHAPAIELTSPTGGHRVLIGPQSLAYVRVGNYPGWDAVLRDEVNFAVDHLFSVVSDLEPTRLGLRYINALRSDAHGIKDIGDLDINVRLAGSSITNSVNVNFKEAVSKTAEITCRISSVDLAQGIIPDNATVILDLDVYSVGTPDEKTPRDVKLWFDQAHTAEKQRFFKILGPDVTARLRADE